VSKKKAQRARLRFGLRIVEERARLGWTQENLAERMRMDTNRIQDAEAGRTNLTFAKIVQFSEALGVEISSLFLAPAPETVRRPGRPSRARKS
jgi:transcriptional regulator with XRE-family HTH domain